MNRSLIFNMFLKLDLRNQKGSLIKKIFSVAFAFVFANSFIALNFFLTYDLSSYSLLCITANSFFILFTVLGDFTNLFFSDKQFNLLTTLPLKKNIFVVSKFLSAFFYIFFVNLLSILPQITFFAFYADSSIKGIISFSILNISFCLFLLSFVLSLYTLILINFYKRAFYLIHLFQLLFIGLIVFSTFRTGTEIAAKYSLFEVEFIKYLPQYYFIIGMKDVLTFCICVFISLIFILIFFYILKRNYFKLHTNLFFNETKSKHSAFKILNKNILPGRALNIFFISNKEKALFVMFKKLILSSKTILLRLIPPVLMPLVFVFISLISNSDKFSIMINFLPGSNGIGIINPAISVTLFICIRLLFFAIKYEDESTTDIKWIYNALPINSKTIITAGKKFIVIYFLLPIVIISIFLLSIKVNFTSILLNYLFLLCGYYFFNMFLNRFDSILPFTLSTSPQFSISKYLDILLSIVMVIVLVFAQNFIFKNVIYAVISVSFLFIIPFLKPKLFKK